MEEVALEDPRTGATRPPAEALRLTARTSQPVHTSTNRPGAVGPRDGREALCVQPQPPLWAVLTGMSPVLRLWERAEGLARILLCCHLCSDLGNDP